MEMDKEQFLREFGKDYGYPDGPKTIDEIRATEFKRLGYNDTVYLDHAGATLYSELQMEAIFKDLTLNVYGNPHSQSDSSLATSEIIRECRQQVLDYCNASAKEYKCIFTSGATAALKMVGEAFPWSNQSHFMYTMENHNSVIGIREYALRQGAIAVAVDVEELVDQDTSSTDQKSLFKVAQHDIQRRNANRSIKEDFPGNARHLFAFPSECNFSGMRFNLDLIRALKEQSEDTFNDTILTKGRWLVLIDAAKGCATEPPDLSKYPADFVVLSFYKIFGYPTGLGALIVRNEAAKLLKKTYFSGGTVAASIADVDFVKHRDGIEESFEDGTASFISIASIRHGFRALNTHTISSISRHTSSLATNLRRVLSSLKHDNGADACIIYGDNSMISEKKGSIVSFNLKRPDGSWYGYREVEKLASLSGIQLRTGCFCNPGACAKYLGLSHTELLSNVEAGHICWDDFDMVNGKPTGAVRVSFGYMSTFEEAKKLVDFLVSSFVVLPIPVRYNCLLRESDIFLIEGSEKMERSRGLYLKSITVYPIKSCAGFCVDSWPLSKTGLLHDREWLLRSPSGEILTQKKAPEMSLISTFIDLSQGILFVESPRCKTKLQILLKSVSYCLGREEMDMHGHRYEVQSYDQEVNSWFSNAIARPCILWRSSASNCYINKQGNAGMCRDVESSLNFVNEAQFLLISEASVMDLNDRLKSKTSQVLQAPITQVSPMRFRPNLLISGGEPYDEDLWRGIRIGSKYFSSLGGCNRCQMINFDHQSEHVHKTSEPLATLASYRREKGRILFGILLRVEKCSLENKELNSWLAVGEEVYPDMR
ncbi:molybdenum cofactor sulfurase-like isoform X1 [Chenopodium quinoa]|uniref:molybdenum cofactor sulfurase-like isoform X1 n=1 Tax=Chenopodium quinoa TaxID=63459 RepID=UPI000B78D087|nr:molybdenum cofactor sulfurase-like isoform X1 [Chenopodium quinoa]